MKSIGCTLRSGLSQRSDLLTPPEHLDRIDSAATWTESYKIVEHLGGGETITKGGAFFNFQKNNININKKGSVRSRKCSLKRQIESNGG
jgi:hypothetical protein